MKKSVSSICLALLVLPLFAVLVATAAVDNTTPSGGFRPMGSSTFWGNSGGRSIRHARDYSQGYQGYAGHGQTVTAECAKQESAGVGQNITAAQLQFGEMRKVTTDKANLASLKVIDQQLVEAAKAHAQMHKMCTMDKVDGTGSMKCCEQVDAALAKAIAEYEKLSKQLEEQTAPVKAS